MVVSGNLNPCRCPTRRAFARPSRSRKAYKVFDERGVFLLVTPSGGRWWRTRYRFAEVERLLTLGAYPDVPLKRAREKREEARRLIADGVDPNAQRRAEEESRADTFEAVAREWLEIPKAERVCHPEVVAGSRRPPRCRTSSVVVWFSSAIECRTRDTSSRATRSACSNNTPSNERLEGGHKPARNQAPPHAVGAWSA